MLDRFLSEITEPTAECASCGAKRPVSDLLFDEQAEHYVCDRRCFDEWHDANMSDVGDFYYRVNVDY